MNEASLKAKLKALSKETDRTFNDLFKQLIFERFLARVCQSQYRNELIFKGGLCLRQYVKTNRETKDLDFLIKKLGVERKYIETIFNEISDISLGDNFQFKSLSLIEMEAEHKKYPGFRIKIPVHMGNMRDSLQVDIGMGDFVQENELEITTLEHGERPMFDEKNISLLAYPPEYIFSEKLQAIIELKAINSRMKDYFDCYSLIKQNAINVDRLMVAIKNTFEQRETSVTLLNDYNTELSITWNHFIKKGHEAPKNFEIVVDTINDYLVSNKIV